MAYKKPKMVAKSAAKKVYLAGCPTNSYCSSGCSFANTCCMMGRLD